MSWFTQLESGRIWKLEPLAGPHGVSQSLIRCPVCPLESAKSLSFWGFFALRELRFSMNRCLLTPDRAPVTSIRILSQSSLENQQVYWFTHRTWVKGT